MTGLVSILLDAMSAVGLCCCDSPLRLRRCAPVTLDPPGQSEAEIPREGPAPLRQALCWPIRGREGTFNARPRDATPSAGRHMTVTTVALKVRQVPLRQ